MRRTLYKFEQWHESSLRTLHNRKKYLTLYNYEKIIQFDREYHLIKGISYARRYKHITYLRTIGELTTKDFNQIDKDEFLNIFEKLKKKNWRERTLVSVVNQLKTFMRWLLDLDERQTVPFMKGFRFQVKEESRINARDMLNQEDINKLISACKSLRDKTIVSFLWESGCRVGELLNIRVEDLRFENGKGVLIELDGKTGRRTIRLIECITYLKAYLEETGKSTGYLFRNELRDEKANYGTIRVQLRRISKRAGLTKPINPHNFRHSRATYLAKIWNEPILRKWFGWSKNSDMPSTYIHLNSNDLDDKVFEMHGMKKANEQEMHKTSCSSCGMLNIKTAMFCSNCGTCMKKELLEKDIINKLIPLVEEVIRDKNKILNVT